jgi:hypothetical protein
MLELLHQIIIILPSVRSIVASYGYHKTETFHNFWSLPKLLPFSYYFKIFFGILSEIILLKCYLQFFCIKRILLNLVLDIKEEILTTLHASLLWINRILFDDTISSAEVMRGLSCKVNWKNWEDWVLAYILPLWWKD